MKRYKILADGKDTYWVFTAKSEEEALEKAREVIGFFFPQQKLSAIEKGI